MKKLNKKAGFTLAELLIVVAIIAILVAIGIPAFSTAMERSRETVDLSNIRGAYAEYMAGTLGGVADTGYYKITLKQRDCDDWIIDTTGFLSNIVKGGTDEATKTDSLDKMPSNVGNAAFKPGVLWVKFTSVEGSEKPALEYVEDDGKGQQPKAIAKFKAYDAAKPNTKSVVVEPLKTQTSGETTTTVVDTSSDWYLTIEH